MKRAWSLCLLAALAAAVELRAQGGDFSVEGIFVRRAFAPQLVSLRWLPSGGAFVVLERGEGGTVDLYRVEASSGRRQLLLRGGELVPPGFSEPILIEDFEFSPDGSKLLIFTDTQRVWRLNTKGTYYVWDFRTRTLKPISTRPGFQMFAKFSPDGRKVGFVRDNNIFVVDLESGVERQLTRDGSEDIINGTTDWVYEEELDLRDAWRFSPDGRKIAFWRFDQSPIPPFYLLDELSLYPRLVPVRYPKAGTDNSLVQLGVVDLETGETRWIDTGPDRNSYIARMDFAGSADSIWFVRLNRHQNRLELLLADVNTGASRVIMTDSDSAWVDVHDPIWIDGGRRFLYLSERDGYAQLFLFGRDGSLIRKVTAGPWDVLEVHGVDQSSGTVYFTAAADGPLFRPLYRIGLDGRGFRRLSSAEGVHNPSFDPSFRYYVDIHSRAGQPPVQTLHRADGSVIRVLADNEPLRRKLDSLGLRRPEFIKVPTAPGVELNGYLIKPPAFDSTKAYPLLMYVYGGPGSQTVLDAWGGDLYLWHQLVVREGYLVASVDNRGTGARGAKFKKVTYLNLGTYETADQIAAARFFGSLPYVDASRIGIWGASYGGYMSLLAMFRGEGVFKAAISRAPVTDWRLYDTIYTERYMRTPQENPEGYRRSAPQTYVELLRGNLLIVHGTGDDNVHPQNTTQLVHLLEEANKQFDLRIYPNKTHALEGARTRLNLYTFFLEWIKKNL
ncbi:MAG: peptidase S9 [Gemmatimonadales bacterium]|nr:MAG: peptidase S9 [Gemmatimonadales bacterium]